MRADAETVWTCRQAEAEIALHAGGDLTDPVAEKLLASHLAKCPACRDYERRMSVCVELLQTCAAESAPPAARVWSRVAAKLPRRAPRTALAQFNAWVPTTAMVAACAAMILVTVLQIDRSVSRPARDLFVTDPVFASNRGGVSPEREHENRPRPAVPVGLPPARAPHTNFEF